MSKTSVHELFTRYEKNPILTASDWPYPANSVFNPAAIIFKGYTLLLVRVEDYRGISHLTVAQSKNGYDNWEIDGSPTFEPDPEHYPEEIWGIEDPRITYVDELKRWVILYTAYSRNGPQVSLATTKNFYSFERIGPVTPADNKDAAIFPIRFNGKWLMLHRGVSKFARDEIIGDLLYEAMEKASSSETAELKNTNYNYESLKTVESIQDGAHIWISYSDDLKHWCGHKILIAANKGGWWDANKIGLSTPPMQTEKGWLILYHGVRNTPSGDVYRLGLALLDLNDPTRVLCRSNEWIFGPKETYEIEGDVKSVVFPCGWVEENGEVRIYYGSADTHVAMATARLSDLLDYIIRFPVN
jgi:predicted GH43/DUF377 family glycosyl hydrolase